MLADFYIPMLSDDIKIAVQKNNLWGQIWYRSTLLKNGVYVLLAELRGDPDAFDLMDGVTSFPSIAFLRLKIHCRIALDRNIFQIGNSNKFDSKGTGAYPVFRKNMVYRVFVSGCNKIQRISMGIRRILSVYDGYAKIRKGVKI